MHRIKSSTVLKAILSLMACYGIFMALADAKGWASTKVADFIFSVGTLALTYLWYYLDAAEKGFRRTSAMGASIILFTLVPFLMALATVAGRVGAGVVARFADDFAGVSEG